MAPRRSSRLRKDSVSSIFINDDETSPPKKTILKKNKTKSKRAVKKNAPNINVALLEREQVIIIPNGSSFTLPSMEHSLSNNKKGKKDSRKKKSKKQTVINKQNENIPPERRKRPQVISLDVTYSSDESDDDFESNFSSSNLFDAGLSSFDKTVEDLPCRTPEDKSPVMMNRKEGRGILSDSSDSDTEDFECRTLKKVAVSHQNVTCDSDSDDIYSLNHEVEEKKILDRVMVEMKALNQGSTCNSKNIEESNANLDDESERPTSVNSAGSSNTPQEIVNCDSPMYVEDDLESLGINMSDVVVKGSKRRSQNKQTKKALQSLKAIAKRLDTYNDSLGDLDDDVLLVSDDEDNSMTLLVRWGTDFFTHRISADKSLYPLYKHIAEQHSVKISQIMLSFGDDVLSPDTMPGDIGLTSADFIDGGILIAESEKQSLQEMDKPKAGEVSLKFQNENRRDCIAININKYDKILTAMEKYCKIKSLTLSKLRFRFDGETLDPMESPYSLDLEGGECIDVFGV